MPTLEPGEEYWRSRQPWLVSRGYQLRPRFRVGWVPSWISRNITDPFEQFELEDHLGQSHSWLMDAVRLTDGKPVMFKRIMKNSADGEEKNITVQLSSLKDSGNRCVPVAEVLTIPDDNECEILIMPLLRPFDSPRFDTIGECVDFFQQIFKGLQFIHHQHVAHRDCSGANVMMDGTEMFPNGFHPVRPMKTPDFKSSAKYYTRTQHPPKYYWIDFGLSVQFEPLTTSPLVLPLHGNDRTVPEFQDPDYESIPQDPFPTDVYYLGNLVRKYFYQGHKFYAPRLGLEFMKPLVDDMVQDDPKKRPTIDECVIRLDEIVHSLSSWKLRSQVYHRSDNIFGYIYRFFPYWMRRISYVIRRVQPIPFRKDDISYFEFTENAV